MYTKGDVITEAYEELRISGLTVDPSTSDIALALNRLEYMMSDMQANQNFTVNYNFEVTPATTSPTGVVNGFRRLMVVCLAMELCAAFGKDAPQSLSRKASSAWESGLSVHQSNNLLQVQPPYRMPQGSGNTFRGLFWNRFMVPTQFAPDAPPNYLIQQGETQSYVEDFSAWLGNATISSFTITVDPLLTVSSSAISGQTIAYTLQAPTQQSSYGPLQQVQITVTSSNGLVQVRTISFNVVTPPVVPEQ